MSIKKSSCILHVSTYPPRKCGIATFTQDLLNAMNKRFNPSITSKILVMNNEDSRKFEYPKEVLFRINDSETQEYVDVARKINEMDEIKVVNVQHEFKIFGFDYGENLLPFLETLKKPSFITFHTVLPAPSEKRKEIIRSIAENSTCLIVVNNIAVEILRNDYGLKKTNIEVVPHGIHEVSFEPSIVSKKKLGYEDRILLSSFGFLRSGKRRKSSGRGYEYFLEALPEVIEKFPNVLYLIIGETHPVIRKKEGEKYRNFLKRKIRALGLEKYVKFINKYVSLDELLLYLKATDIYISSSLNPEQISSGTLSYAIGCGCAVVSTPFLNAKDAVTLNRGILLEDFRKPELFSEAVIKILSNPSLREKMEKNAYEYTRQMTWSNVAESYMKLFNKYAKAF